MSNNSKIFLGIITAAAVGAVIGLLMAPDKGSDTRKRVTKSLGDLADEIVKAASTGKEQFNNALDNASTKVKGTVNDAVEYANYAKASVKP